ncbi:MAG: hypothetical protein HZB39_10450 [Planctomycetes bacterium]|nr:hypothetical protein [Planctomycetota bacterium]
MIDDGSKSPAITSAALSAPIGRVCGGACVEKASSGCCKDGAKDGAKDAQKPVSTKPVSKEQGADCCETTTQKTAAPKAGGCCDAPKGATPVAAPAKKN